MVAVYDARGAHVATLVNEVVGAGAHTVRWSGTDASGRNVGSGVYFARIAHGGAVRTEKLVLLK
jgi:flagellar hook assembly protein FlgD